MAKSTAVLLTAFIVVVAACSSSSTEPSPVTTTPTAAPTAPTTAAATSTSTTMPSTTTARPTTTTTTTTAAPTTTTTTAPPVVAWDGAPETIASPLDILDGFRFEFAMFDSEGDDVNGMLVTGVYVAPDTTRCTFSNPALVSPTIGTVLASGSSAWWDDGFVMPSESERTGWEDDLSVCPGAREFWEEPFWTTSDFSLAVSNVEEEIDGLPSRRVDIIATNETMAFTEAALWVAPDGYPLRLEIEGTIEGGVARIAGWGEFEPDPVSVEIALDIGDRDTPALHVRAPDGELLAGPIGEITPTVAALPPVPQSIAPVVDLARRSECPQWNTTELIIGDYEIDELDLAAITAQSGGREEGLLVVNTYPGLPTGFDQRMTTSAEGSVALVHAELYYRDVAPFVAFFEWTGVAPDPWAGETAGLRIPVVNARAFRADEPDGPVAVWDGSVIALSAELPIAGMEPAVEHEISYHFYLRMPDPDLAMTDEQVDSALAWMLPWVDDVSDALSGVPRADLQAVENLRALSGDIREMVLAACGLLGTAWVDADDAIGRNASRSEVVGYFADEVAAQNMLLFLEYVDVIVAHLERPDVDWLTGDDVTFRRSLLGGNTDATFLHFFVAAALALDGVMTPEDMRDVVGVP